MKKYIKVLLYSLLTLLIGVLISSILYYFNIFNSKLNSIFLFLSIMLSIFIGSYKLSKILNKKGLLVGTYYFIFYFIIMMACKLIFKDKIIFKNIIYYIILLLVSVVAAIISKNKRKS